MYDLLAWPARPLDEPTTMTPQDLKSIMGSGLLSFPVTDFDAQGNFNP
ncbi:hypothetical protein HNP48_006625, partial [Acidovorax soli]|nr:hypothetical protein [Acidovorax soli]